jgi:hypothetical protein
MHSLFICKLWVKIFGRLNIDEVYLKAKANLHETPIDFVFRVKIDRFLFHQVSLSNSVPESNP